MAVAKKKTGLDLLQRIQTQYRLVENLNFTCMLLDSHGKYFLGISFICSCNAASEKDGEKTQISTLSETLRSLGKPRDSTVSNAPHSLPVLH